MHPSSKADLNCFSDSDWAGDNATRKSTSGALICLNETPIIFKSQKQHLVALSTTEAEYVAAGVAGVEIVNMDQVRLERN